MGRKLWDEASGLWRVYDATGVELADPGGVMLRGLHGWLLRGSAVFGGKRLNYIWFARIRSRR